MHPSSPALAAVFRGHHLLTGSVQECFCPPPLTMHYCALMSHELSRKFTPTRVARRCASRWKGTCCVDCDNQHIPAERHDLRANSFRKRICIAPQTSTSLIAPLWILNGLQVSNRECTPGSVLLSRFCSTCRSPSLYGMLPHHFGHSTERRPRRLQRHRREPRPARINMLDFQTYPKDCILEERQSVYSLLHL